MTVEQEECLSLCLDLPLSVGKNNLNVFNTSIQEIHWNELSGSFGFVMTAKCHDKTIVVKKLLKQHERNLRLFFKEAKILQLLDSTFGRGLRS